MYLFIYVFINLLQNLEYFMIQYQQQSSRNKLVLSETNCSSESQGKPSLAQPYRNFKKQLQEDQQQPFEQLDESGVKHKYKIRLYQPTQESESQQNSLSIQNSHNIIRYSHPALCVDSQSYTSSSSQEGVRPYTFTQYKTGQIMTIMNQNFDEYQSKMKELFQQKFGLISQYFLSSRTSENQITSSDNSEKFRRQTELNRIHLYRKEPQHYSLPINHENPFQLFVVRKTQGKFVKSYSFEIYQANTMKQLLQVQPVDKGYHIIYKNLKNHHIVLSIINTNFFRTKYYITSLSQHFEHKNIAHEEAIIKFSFDSLFMNDYQKIAIKIPKANIKCKKNKKLKQCKVQNLEQNYETYVSKQPRWNPQIKRYVLDFNHKKCCFSNKNFIIVPKQSKGKSIVSLCKLRTNLYRAQVASPFSLLQGVGLIVSNLDQRL